MTFKSTAAKAGIAAIALTALGLAATMPASAHTNNMFTYVIYDENTEQAGFATYGKGDGVTTPLPTTFVPEMVYIAGIEVAGEKGTVLGRTGGPFVREWNHTTGERGLAISVYLTAEEGAEFSDVDGLDTLNDGRTITIVQYYTGDDERWAIANVNSGTGELTILVDLIPQISEEGDIVYEPTSLATDPATGITYVFLQAPDGTAGYLSVNVATNEFVEQPTELAGDYFVEGAVLGVDFDGGTGELYFNYDNYDEGAVELVKFATGPSTWATAEPVYISTAPADEDDVSIADLALTIEHTALAATGSELPIFAIMLVGTVAVLAGGVTIAVARRRSETGTV